MAKDGRKVKGFNLKTGKYEYEEEVVVEVEDPYPDLNREEQLRLFEVAGYFGEKDMVTYRKQLMYSQQFWKG